jgi:hypothetical protein
MLVVRSVSPVGPLGQSTVGTRQGANVQHCSAMVLDPGDACSEAGDEPGPCPGRCSTAGAQTSHPGEIRPNASPDIPLTLRAMS